MNEEFEDEVIEDDEDEVIEDDEDDDDDSYDYAGMEDYLGRTRKVRYYPAEPLPSLRQRLAYFVYEKQIRTFWQRLRKTCINYTGEDGKERERFLALWIDGKFYIFKPISFQQEIPAPHEMEYMGRVMRFASGPPKFVLSLKVMGKDNTDRQQKYNDLCAFNGKARADWRAAYIDICDMPFYIETLIGSFLAESHRVEVDMTLALRLESAYGQHDALCKDEGKNRKRFEQYRTRESQWQPT